MSDNDAFTRKILTNKTDNGNGCIPIDMTPPEFLCDFNHRIKAMVNPFLAFSQFLLRIKQNIGWYVRGYRNAKTKRLKISSPT